MTYAGVCYDGPWEGEQYASQARSFNVALIGRVGLNYYQAEGLPGVRHGRYNWSYALRKWVFES